MRFRIQVSINRLIAQYNKGLKEDIVKDINQTGYQFESHFIVEEMLLEGVGSPHTKDERDAHEKYHINLMEILIEHPVDDVLIYLITWWTEHILVDNMKFKGEL